MSRGIIAGGNFIVDYVKTIDHFPVEQTLANIKHEYTGSGGAPYNVLLSLVKLGSNVPLAAIGRIGDDQPGRLIVEDLSKNGVDVAQLRQTPGHPTSYTIVTVVESTGKRTFFHQRGANALLAPQDFDFTRAQASHFHYGYLLLLDQMDAPDSEFGIGAARVLAAAKAAGLTTSIDLVSEDSDRFRTVLPSVLRYTDIAFMNEFEAERASGIQLMEHGRMQTERIGLVPDALEFRDTLVIHWPEGSVACIGKDLRWQASVDLPGDRIVSTVGSGDAFAAGFLLAFTRGDSIEVCLQLGTCCAASCVTGYTCTDAVRSEKDCLDLGEHYGFRLLCAPVSSDRMTRSRGTRLVD